ncbi:M23 family metallopeptidase, partial [bacterium]|nr:M23 family metallopeptidase [bacterium]
VSPYGYGRAVYLQLDTGETAVFGHLQRFSAPLEEMISALQIEKGCFTVSKRFGASEFPIAQGEILAYTGQSGIGPPHLHFELRDSLNRPINPLAKPYQITDTQPPVVRNLAVIPLAGGTQINGTYEPQIFQMHRDSFGNYQLASPLYLFGKVGLAVETYDPIDQTTNKLGAYQIRLWVDEALVYDVSYERFDYARTHEIALIYDYRLQQGGAGRFHRCFKDPAVQLEMCAENEPGAGILENQTEFVWHNPSRHTFQIELADFSGNTSIVSGEFIWKKQHREFVVARGGLHAKNMKINSTFQDGWVDFEVIANQPLEEIPQLRLIQPGVVSRNIPLAAVDGRHFRGFADYADLRDGVMFLEASALADTQKIIAESQCNIQLVPLSGKSIQSADGFCQLSFPANAVYRPAIVQCRGVNDSFFPFADYCFAGKAYHFSASVAPFRNAARLTIEMPHSLSNPKIWGIYSSRDGEKWHFAG